MIMIFLKEFNDHLMIIILIKQAIDLTWQFDSVYAEVITFSEMLQDVGRMREKCFQRN